MSSCCFFYHFPPARPPRFLPPLYSTRNLNRLQCNRGKTGLSIGIISCRFEASFPGLPPEEVCLSAYPVRSTSDQTTTKHVQGIITGRDWHPRAIVRRVIDSHLIMLHATSVAGDPLAQTNLPGSCCCWPCRAAPAHLPRSPVAEVWPRSGRDVPAVGSRRNAAS